MDKVNKDLRYQEIFGQIPPRFCTEVKAIIYNECLTAAKCMKDNLEKVTKYNNCKSLYYSLHHPLKVDSSKSEDIHSCLTCFLNELDIELEGHTEQLQEYLYMNYVPEPSLPLYGEGVVESTQATEQVNQLRRKLKATLQLNEQLTEKIEFLKVWIAFIFFSAWLIVLNRKKFRRDKKY